MASNPIHFWLRAETKELEKRTPLLPVQCRQLIESGHRITVERSAERCVPDSDYEAAGCFLVPTASWKEAPKDAYILGLKDLPETDEPLTHSHIMFGHCYKQQRGWQQFLKRFVTGKGTLLDLEFLVDDRGRRVAAFGRSAGFIGMALGLKAWAYQQLTGKTLGKVEYYSDSQALVDEIKKELEDAWRFSQKRPKIMIMGALGRCGTGAVDFCRRVGIQNITDSADPNNPLLLWDLEETKAGGPFKEILNVDIFVNCIYLNTPIPPFITNQLIDQEPNRNLSIVVDVSCDTSNPHNPLPVYSQSTSFLSTSLRLRENSKPLDIIAIDHLPSLVPLESSMEFSELLVRHLNECGQTDVWKRAHSLYLEKSTGL